MIFDDDEGTPPPVSAKQTLILQVIADWVQRHGYSPTVREIGAAVGLRSPSSVTHHLKALERHGLVRRARSPRTLRSPSLQATAAVEEGHTVRVPLLGTVAAGYPILAEQLVEDDLLLPISLVGRGTMFALNVKGDSMVEAAICDGDTVIVRQQPVAHSGDIVAALIDGEATIKAYRTRGGRVELVPCNPLYKVLSGDNAVILGKVTCVLRRL